MKKFIPEILIIFFIFLIFLIIFNDFLQNFASLKELLKSLDTLSFREKILCYLLGLFFSIFLYYTKLLHKYIINDFYARLKNKFHSYIKNSLSSLNDSIMLYYIDPFYCESKNLFNPIATSVNSISCSINENLPKINDNMEKTVAKLSEIQIDQKRTSEFFDNMSEETFLNLFKSKFNNTEYEDIYNNFEFQNFDIHDLYSNDKRDIYNHVIEIINNYKNNPLMASKSIKYLIDKYPLNVQKKIIFSTKIYLSTKTNTDLFIYGSTELLILSTALSSLPHNNQYKSFFVENGFLTKEGCEKFKFKTFELKIHFQSMNTIDEYDPTIRIFKALFA